MEFSRCLELLPSAASDSGVKYELKIAALLFIRAQKNGFKFEIFRNVKVALPFDDIVIRLSKGNDSRLFFVQLKHGEHKGAVVGLECFHPKKKDGAKFEKGDFNLRKYYTLCERLYQIHQGEGNPPTEDEKILNETPLDKVWFLIYTNKIINPAPKDSEAQQSQDMEIMTDIFTTGESGTFFGFDKEEKNFLKIWNQMDHDEKKERIYQEVFLPRLKIFHGQIHVDDLDDTILFEIKGIIGSPLPKESPNNILENFLEAMEKWTKETRGTNLSHHDTLLEKAVAQELRRRVQEVITFLQFKDENLKEIEEWLRKSRKKAKTEKVFVPIQISVQEISPGLRASKILQVLQKDECYRNSWICVNDWLLQTYSLEAITSPFRAIDFLIIDLPKENKYEQQMLLKRGKDFPICVFEFTTEYNATVTENWSLEDLAIDCQTKLLKRPVHFQGQEVKLGDLEQAWPCFRDFVDGAALDDLLSGRSIDIGEPLPTLDPLYINRKVQHEHCRIVRPSIFEIRSAENYFVLKNFSKELLQGLRSHDSPWEECDVTWNPVPENMLPKKLPSAKSKKSDKTQLIRTKWTIEKENQQINLRVKGNIHWLTMKEGEMNWTKSHRKLDIIVEHSENKKGCLRANSTYCTHDNANDLLNWKDKGIILADAPGKGKSTFITYIASQIKVRYKTNWVIIIRLNYGNVFNKLPNEIDKIGNVEVLDTLFNAVHIATKKQSLKWRHFLEAAFKETGFINIFVDGVDEVCPSFKAKALRLLEIIRNSMEKSGGKIWVATRPVLEQDLKNVLSCRTPLALLPYSRKDQINYILWRWKDTLHDLDEAEREKRVAYFVDTVRRATSTEEISKETYSLTDLPLYTRMLAEVYLGTEFYTNQNFVAMLRNTLHRLNLYKSFVTKTIERMWEKVGLTEEKREDLNISGDNRLEMHKHYAAVEYFDESGELVSVFPSLNNSMQQITSFQIEKQAKTGLISSIVDGKPAFVHYTIVEFLAAWWLFDEWNRDFNKVNVIIKKLLLEKYSVCRYFFDAFLAEGKPIHEIILGDRPYVFLQLELTGCLESSNHDRRDKLIENQNLIKANERDSGGRTPLHLACIIGDFLSVKILLQAGADPNVKDQVLNWTGLRYTDSMIWKGASISGILNIIDLLLESGASSEDFPNTSKDINIYQEILNKHHVNITLAMLKENISDFFKFIVKSNYLLKCVMDDRYCILECLLKSDVFLKWLSGPYSNLTRLLFTAVENNKINVCKILLENGADVNGTQKEEYTPLMFAIKNGYSEIYHALISKGANINVKNKEGNTPLMFAAKAGHVDICQALISSGACVDAVNNVKYTPLLFAAEKGNEHVCQILIERGADVNMTSRNDNTPLSIAVVRRHENVCRLLVDRGADIEKKHIWKWFKDNDKHKIHFAADVGSLQFCRCCIENGIDPNIKDKKGRTPLMFASTKGHLKTTTMLLNNGGDVNLKDKKGWTSLMLAAMGGCEHVCSILIENKADIKLKNKDGNAAISLAAQNGHNDVCLMLINSGSEINGRYKDQSTLLLLSARFGHETVSRTLVYKQADVNATDQNGNTPLHAASAKGFDTVCRILLVNGASINSVNHLGDSPLHCAAESGHEIICRCLVTFGADTNAQNYSGDTPLHYAARLGHESVCGLLIANGALTNVVNKFKSTPTDEAFANKHNSLYNILRTGVYDDCGSEMTELGSEHGQRER